jgi:hypothetical protein
MTFWNGTGWADEPADATPPSQRQRSPRRLVSTGLIVVVITALLMPTIGASASGLPGHRLRETWSEHYIVRTIQEADARIAYSGAWARASFRDYLGGSARYSDRAGSKATLRFSGTAIAWIGPKGPTRRERLPERSSRRDGEHVRIPFQAGPDPLPSNVLEAGHKDPQCRRSGNAPAPDRRCGRVHRPRCEEAASDCRVDPGAHATASDGTGNDAERYGSVIDADASPDRCRAGGDADPDRESFHADSLPDASRRSGIPPVI